MASSYEIETLSQNSIYNKSQNCNKNNRKIKVYFSIPQKGVNENTGILLFIAEFGGQSTSNVYKKMRDKFSDKYNLVTVQCDYFGYEFMQSTKEVEVPNIDKMQLNKILSHEDMTEIYKDGQFNFNTFLKVGSKYKMNLNVRADLSKESTNNFNDMGLLQTIDNITSVLSVMNVLYDNNLNFNSKKVIIYGHSHGAYLAYLCNAFAPTLFSLIIDNSAWLHPVYIDDNRAYTIKIGELTLTTVFDYLAKKIIRDNEILSIPYLYSKFKNNCKVISYHGVSDNLISCKDKSIFCNNIDNCIYNEISQKEVDNIVFKSTNHGLDCDFIKLFDFTMNSFNIKFEKNNRIDLKNEVNFITHKHKYSINYENIMPQIYVL